jgi:hypothetical protein
LVEGFCFRPDDVYGFRHFVEPAPESSETPPMAVTHVFFAHFNTLVPDPERNLCRFLEQSLNPQIFP